MERVKTDFNSFTDDELNLALDAIHDSAVAEECLERNDPVTPFLFDLRLQRLLFIWLESGMDRVYTKLKDVET